MDVRTDGQTDGRTDGRRTDFDTKLIYPFFLKKKAGITNQLCAHYNMYNSYSDFSENLNLGLTKNVLRKC